MTKEQLDELWVETLNIVKGQLNMPTFKTWFENTTPLSNDQNTLVVSAPNSFAREWLESRYSQLLSQSLSQVADKEMIIKFIVKNEEEVIASPDPEKKNLTTVGPRTETEKIPPETIRKPLVSLNPKYTFESFVIGGSNRFAHAAALAVAENPSKAYNPLFVYGGVGLGKTHLLQAIGHYVLNHHNGLDVKYLSTEKFTNDFINSIRDKNKIMGFQKKYRDIDVLLIDDIQFLENKEATQEEFFHTFNTLYQANRQIVISSDRPPKDLSTLEDRLKSRFEWGLITDIQPPDLETRIAILRKKAQIAHLDLPNDVMELVASRIHSNIRELEGALVRIIAFSSLTKSNIDINLAKDVIKDIFPERVTGPITINTIQKEVCGYFDIKKTDLKGSKRNQSLAYPRQIAMYLCRDLTDLSLPKIGQEFGGRDHTTVMHANSKIERLMNEKREVYNQIQKLTTRIKQVS